MIPFNAFPWAPLVGPTRASRLDMRTPKSNTASTMALVIPGPLRSVTVTT